jgi:hypothetical protein
VIGGLAVLQEFARRQASWVEPRDDRPAFTLSEPACRPVDLNFEQLDFAAAIWRDFADASGADLEAALL